MNPLCHTNVRDAMQITVIGRRIPTPLRNHRTGFQKACQVIASALCREMSERQNNRPTRKLVIFSDSRQDAAKLAAGMERDHFQGHDSFNVDWCPEQLLASVRIICTENCCGEHKRR